MNRVSFLIGYCALVFGVIASLAAAQTVHVVGDSLGWTVPPNATVYSNWASSKTFMVGDILVFNFMANSHDVVQVPLASYNDCSDDNAIGNIFNDAVNITLDSAGDRHYICSLGRHCESGQKLSLTVVSSSPPGVATPPITTPPPATPTTPSPASPDQPDDCAPTPLPAPKADGPAARATPPPPPPPNANAASISQASSFLLVIMSAGLALFF
ncbi:hypothetical protein C2S51_007350 [Perilla frutescens var. frutescens]|nr:hypothetical protein C2S51_007350 [Perilla frutescens var. frutescens]